MKTSLKNAFFQFEEDERDIYYQFKPVRFGILFGYNKCGKDGYRIDFSYNQCELSLSIILLHIAGTKETVIGEQKYADVKFKDLQDIPVQVSVKKDACRGALDKYAFHFPLAVPKGRIGIAVSSVFRGITFTDAEIISQEKIPKKLVYSKNRELPSENGGVIPYTLRIDIYSYFDTVYEMEYSLDGGISAREQTDMHADVWLYHYDDITNPYIKVINKKTCKKYFLFNGEARFYDSNGLLNIRNLFGHVYNMKDTPICGNFFFTEFDENDVIGFGYENFKAWGYEAMQGLYEYLFGSGDKLIYRGAPLETELVTRLVSLDKKMVSEIPEDIYDYDDAVEHAQNNHYFFTDEIPSFQLLAYTKLNREYLSVKVSLLDAFYRPLKDIVTMPCEMDPEFMVNEYRLLCCPFHLPALCNGVYHISIDILYGDRMIGNHCAAFEVLDAQSQLSPQEASGLPVMYVGDGAPPLSEASVPDFYAQKSEFDWGHYFGVALYLPIGGQKKRVWEILKLYKRHLFTWITQRTIKGYDTAKLQEIITRSDYINYIYPGLEDCSYYWRYDLFDFAVYGSRFVQETLNDFLDMHPGYKEELKIRDVTEQFTEEDLLRLLKLCGGEWLSFCLEKIEDRFLQQTGELKKRNPDQRRCSYGPYPMYFSPYKSGYAIKWYGFDPEKIHEVFDGFLQYEDYPFTCAYNSYAGAWGILTTKLLDPEIKIYPELYMSFPNGCPDGAVACAYPPLGGSRCPVYFTMTQVCEYVYNTPYYRDGKFSYWYDYGFSVFSFIDYPKERARCLLTLWGNVLKYRPVRPHKTAAFLYEINPKEDRYDYEVAGHNFYNVSESNLSYVYGEMKASGLSGGFAVKAKDLLSLSEEEINCLVLPDMTDAAPEILDKVRELHKHGVVLVAVGKIPGLEELFGVEERPQTVTVRSFSNGTESEYVTPNQAEFFYKNQTGKAKLLAEGTMPVIITKNNCILLNTSIAQAGIDSLVTSPHLGRPNISRLLNDTMVAALHAAISSQVSSSYGSGVTVLETESGEDILLITDYSKHDQCSLDRPVYREVQFDIEHLSDAEYINVCHDAPQIHKIYRHGILKGMSVMLYPQETFMFRLIYSRE